MLRGLVLLSFFCWANVQAAEFSVTIEGRGSHFKGRQTKEPVERFTIHQPSDSPLQITAFGKTTKTSEQVLWIEVHLENRTDKTIRNVTLNLTEGSSSYLFDYTNDGQNKAKLSFPLEKKFSTIAPHGIIRTIIGLPWRYQRVFVQASIRHDAPSAVGAAPTRSAALVAAKKSERVWAVNTDNNQVVVIDARSDRIVKRISVPKAPAAIAISQDEKMIAVASQKANRVTIIHQPSMTILQTLGQNDSLGRELTGVVFAATGHDLYVSSYVEGTVTKLTLRSDGRLRNTTTLSVGARPSGLTINPENNMLYVSHFLPRGTVKNNEAWISNIELSEFQPLQETLIEDHFNPGSEKLKCLADFYSSNIITRTALGKVSPEDLAFEGVASQIQGVYLDPSAQNAWVAGSRITGAIVVLEKGEDADPNLRRFGGLQPGQYVPAILFMHSLDQDGRLQTMYANDREMALPTAERILECSHHPYEIEFIPRDILDARKKEQTNIFLAYGIPQAGMTDIGVIKTVTFTKGGRRALLLAPSSDEIAVYDGVTQNPISIQHTQLSGSNPKDLIIGPSGDKAYVLYENSDHLSVLDIAAYNQESRLPRPYYVPYYYNVTMANPIQLGAVQGLPLIRRYGAMPTKPEISEIKQITIRKDPMPPKLRRGKILFESANPDRHKVSLSRLGACASCHPGGGSDGSSWVTMEGPRRTMSLRGGVENRGYLHVSSTHANAAEFVDQVVRERLGGSLGEQDLEALAEYVAHGIPTLQSPRVDPIAREEGKRLFQRNCAYCHQGSAYTSGTQGADGLFDIGSISEDHGVSAGAFFQRLLAVGGDAGSAEILSLLQGDRDLGEGDRLQEILGFRQRPTRQAGKFKAPTLQGIADHALFFHDGSEDTLRGAIEKIDRLLYMELSSREIDALEAYLKTL